MTFQAALQLDGTVAHVGDAETNRGGSPPGTRVPHQQISQLLHCLVVGVILRADGLLDQGNNPRVALEGEAND